MARSEVNKLYDAETAFRAPASVAITATAVIGELALDKMVATRGDQKDKLGAQGYEVVLAVSALETGNGDEVYTFDVQVGAAGAAATVVGTLIVDAVGQFVIALDAATIEKLDADHEAIELNLTVAGVVAPSITFAAWLL